MLHFRSALLLYFLLSPLISWASYLIINQDTQKNTPPSQGVFLEGTEIDLSEEEVKELRRWVDTAQVELKRSGDILRNKATPTAKRDALVLHIKNIVEKSGTKDNEVLTRIVLNRALKVVEICQASEAPIVIESTLLFLLESIELAKKVYVSDKAYLVAISDVSQAKPESSENFAFDYAEMLMRLSGSFLNPEMEYFIMRAGFGWLGHDLNSSRNLNRALFSEEIILIKDLIDRDFPKEIASDAVERQTHNLIFNMRREYRENLRKNLVAKISGLREKIVAEERALAALKRQEELKNNPPAVRLKNGTVVGTVVHVTVNDAGVEEVYIEDNASKLVWGPTAPKKLNFEDAKKYCEDLKEKFRYSELYDKKWYLPSIEEFRFAFYPKNPDFRKYFYNEALVEALPDLKGRFWSSSVTDIYFTWIIDGDKKGRSDECMHVLSTTEYSFRCVGASL